MNMNNKRMTRTIFLFSGKARELLLAIEEKKQFYILSDFNMEED